MRAETQGKKKTFLTEGEACKVVDSDLLQALKREPMVASAVPYCG